MTTTTSNDEKTTLDTDLEADTGRDARPPRQVSLTTLITGIVVITLVACSATFAVLYFSARSTIDASARAAQDRAHAEQLATDYAVGAATTDYRDLDGWFDRLVHNTSPELTAKFEATTPQLQQILVPLTWVSTAAPITAKVRSAVDGVYTVDAFVSVSSTSAQAPQGAKTTVAYSVTFDSATDWVITDIGGFEGGALPN